MRYQGCEFFAKIIKSLHRPKGYTCFLKVMVGEADMENSGLRFPEDQTDSDEDVELEKKRKSYSLRLQLFAYLCFWSLQFNSH